jgi:anti-sigma regulatory factor (Ser/Thr protein kinase)
VIPPPSGRTDTLHGATRSQSASKSPSDVGPASHASARGGLSRVLRSYLELAALPTAPSCARLHTKQMLWEWGLNDLSDVGGLIVSELVTNAVQITARQDLVTPVRLWLSRHSARVLIEVWDADRTPPTLKALDADGLPPVGNAGGRGLFLVANLSKRWGWYPERTLGGKVVWAECALEAPDCIPGSTGRNSEVIPGSRMPSFC